MLGASTVNTRRLFPLHLTPFEHYALVDDGPRHPMTFVLQLEFSGQLDPDAFGEAIDYSVSRQPLLQALVQPAKQKRDCWVSAGDVKPMVDWGDLDKAIVFQAGEYINLRREVGLRIWIRYDRQRAIVTTQFHHCVCDGIGSYQFLGDVLWSYASRTGEALSTSPPPLDPVELRMRGRASYNPDNFRLKNGRIQSAWGDAARLLLRRTAVLRPARRAGLRRGTPYVYPGIRSRTLDKSQFRKLRLTAQQRGQTSNDLLTEKLFLTLRRWNRQHGGLGLGNSLCVMMPMDLRDVAQAPVPAANIVTYAFIRRGRRMLRRPELLNRSLREEMLMLKRDRHHSRFMNILAGGQRFPFLLRAALFGNRCLATAVLSNTGDPTRRFLVDLPRENGAIRCGNLRLEDVSGVPPMRARTRATISIFTYRRVLKICMRCNPYLFAPEDTQALLDAYVDRVCREIPV